MFPKNSCVAVQQNVNLKIEKYWQKINVRIIYFFLQQELKLENRQLSMKKIAMRNKKLNKSFDRDFHPYKNTSICYITLKEIETPVRISRESNKVLMSFSFEGKSYNSEEIIFDNEHDYLNMDPSIIRFKGIDLKVIDLANLAKCVDKMIDFLYQWYNV